MDQRKGKASENRGGSEELRAATPDGGLSRDEEAARKFEVEWSTKSKGKIANLAGCYLRAARERVDIEIELLDAIMRKCGQLIPDRGIDLKGQLYGISSAKEVVARMLKERLTKAKRPSFDNEGVTFARTDCRHPTHECCDCPRTRDNP